MDESLEKALLDMEAQDQAVRNELTAAGALNDKYHPRLEEVHRANASRLRQIIAVFGWPGITLVGDKGAKAAWRIALHAISEPPFMRQCRDLIEQASDAGDAPRWQFAIIDDRIRVYEGRPQRYGTQLRVGPNGLEPHPIENEGARELHACAGGVAAPGQDRGAGARATAAIARGTGHPRCRGARIPPDRGLDLN